jgi:hypothetical protein
MAAALKFFLGQDAAAAAGEGTEVGGGGVSVVGFHRYHVVVPGIYRYYID